MFYLGSVQPDYLRFCLQSEILARCHLKRKLFENLMKRPFFVVAFSLCLSHRIQFAFRVFVVGRSQSVFCLGTPNSLSEARFFGVLGSGSWVFLFLLFSRNAPSRFTTRLFVFPSVAPFGAVQPSLGQQLIVICQFLLDDFCCSRGFGVHIYEWV